MHCIHRRDTRVPPLHLALLFALLATLAGAGCKRSPPATGSDGLSLRYTVDVSRAGTDWIQLALEVTNLPAGRHLLLQGGNPATTTIRAITARAGDRAVKVTESPDLRAVWRLTTSKDDGPLTVRWEARQGGLSRHGHEGYVGKSFALVDGGVFLVPRKYFRQEVKGWHGSSDVERIRVKVKPRPGWQVVSNMKSDATGELDPAVKGRWKVTHLTHCNIGLGQFDLVQRRIGEVNNRVYVYRGWRPEKKKRVASGALQLFRVFDKQAPCSDVPTYTTIFLPAAADRKTVTGQFWSTGQAYSIDAYEDRPNRVWELYAHRIAHAINRYHVCGTHIDSDRERWFTEGWASWVEVTHTRAAKVIGNEQQLVTLGARYQATALGATEVKDCPIFHEAKRSYKDLTLYLHYVKGPLVVQHLDWELQQRTGGKKSVNGFIKAIYPAHRGHQKNLQLKRELERYSGLNLDRFFRRYVDRTGFLYPLHRQYLEHVTKLELEGADATPALTVDGQSLGARQHGQLVRVLAKIDVKEPPKVRERLIELLLVAAEYGRRDLEEVPQEMIALADKLPGSVRLLIFRHQKSLLAKSAEAYRKWLTAARAKAKVSRPH